MWVYFTKVWVVFGCFEAVVYFLGMFAFSIQKTKLWTSIFKCLLQNPIVIKSLQKTYFEGPEDDRIFAERSYFYQTNNGQTDLQCSQANKNKSDCGW